LFYSHASAAFASAAVSAASADSAVFSCFVVLISAL